jgi:hypothetical protein
MPIYLFDIVNINYMSILIYILFTKSTIYQILIKCLLCAGQMTMDTSQLIFLEFTFWWIESKSFLDCSSRPRSVRKVKPIIHSTIWTWQCLILYCKLWQHDRDHRDHNSWAVTPEGWSNLVFMFLISIALHFGSNLDMDCQPLFNIKKVM